jgi:hypothetical protein
VESHRFKARSKVASSNNGKDERVTLPQNTTLDKSANTVKDLGARTGALAEGVETGSAKKKYKTVWNGTHSVGDFGALLSKSYARKLVDRAPMLWWYRMNPPGIALERLSRKITWSYKKVESTWMTSFV